MSTDRFAIAEERHFNGRNVSCYVNRPRSMLEAFDDTVAQAPRADAVIDAESRLNYASVDNRSRRLASALDALGVEPGERVAIAMENHAGFLFALLAAWRLGAIAVPVNVREGVEGFSHILNDCSACVLIADASVLERLPSLSAVASVHSLIVRGAGSAPAHSDVETIDFAACMDSPPRSRSHTASEEDVATLLYTSGTTGKPKGAMLTHFNIIHTARHYEHHWQLQRGDRAILAVPASHVTGLAAILSTSICLAGCTVMIDQFRAEEFAGLAERERVNWTILVPAMYRLCLLRGDLSRRDLSAWRVGGFGGAPMPSSTVDETAQLLPDLQLLNAYGSTECTSIVTGTPAGDRDTSGWSVGRAVACCEVRIMNGARESQPGEAGEVWLKGPNTVPGYWNNPQKTADEFVDGFWRSGDLGTLDPNGYLILHDRIDDVINRGGYKIYGAEVENTISAVDGVVEAAVIATFDEVLGEKTLAVVFCGGNEITAGAIRTYCAQQLADYKVPDRVEFSSEPLPRNAAGKILKRALREQYQP